MRDLILLAFIFGTLLVAMRYPFVALLLWGWFTLAAPQQSTYFANALSINTVIAVVAIGALAVHGEFGRARLTGVSWLLLAFLGWLGIAQMCSLAPSESALYTDRFVKVVAFVFLCSITATSRLRVHALLWLLVLTIGFYGAKGGLFTILTLGQTHLFGPDNTILYDNNHLGIAMAAMLPLMVYVAHRARHGHIKTAAWIVLGLTTIAIVGTQSRGAFLTTAVVGLLFWWRSHRKVLFGGLAALAALPSLIMLPSTWTDRMGTIAEASQDASFTGRVDAWVINWELALANPITGTGMRVPYIPEVAATVSDRTPRAAHSIYFEVLGGTGFVGLALYLGLFAVTMRTARKTEKTWAGTWRADLARYGQISLIAFGVGGASASMEMWEGYLMVMALLSLTARSFEKAPSHSPTHTWTRMGQTVPSAP